jgi:hypothetical protein
MPRRYRPSDPVAVSTASVGSNGVKRVEMSLYESDLSSNRCGGEGVFIGCGDVI